jgi:hypothetical protein
MDALRQFDKNLREKIRHLAVKGLSANAQDISNCLSAAIAQTEQNAAQGPEPIAAERFLKPDGTTEMRPVRSQATQNWLNPPALPESAGSADLIVTNPSYAEYLRVHNPELLAKSTGPAVADRLRSKDSGLSSAVSRETGRESLVSAAAGSAYEYCDRCFPSPENNSPCSAHRLHYWQCVDCGCWNPNAASHCTRPDCIGSPVAAAQPESAGSALGEAMAWLDSIRLTYPTPAYTWGACAETILAHIAAQQAEIERLTCKQHMSDLNYDHLTKERDGLLTARDDLGAANGRLIAERDTLQQQLAEQRTIARDNKDWFDALKSDFDKQAKQLAEARKAADDWKQDAIQSRMILAADAVAPPAAKGQS